MAAVVLVLALVGAGSKAGLVPLHVWLPLAHPAAPSHVSALMSGVMTKVAVYGFVRIVFDLIGPLTWWWSVVVLAIGGVTAVLGVLYALMQDDLKRILAYSTIENIGLIFVGLGLALAFQANGMTGAAALAFTAALFHVLNHSLFKSLLFFGAGAVLTATGERDMDQLGGLIHRMPQTSFAVLVGCAAISALPPLNGFVSEWLLLPGDPAQPRPAAMGPEAHGAGGRGAAGARRGARRGLLRPALRHDLPRPAADTGCGRRARGRPLLARRDVCLRVLCLAAGILPGFVIDALSPLVAGLLGDAHARPVDDPVAVDRPDRREPQLLQRSSRLRSSSLASASIAAVAIHRFASHALRRAPAWDCGFPDPSPATQYTGSSFAQPIRRVFGTIVFRAVEHVDMPPPGDTRPARFSLDLRDLVWDVLYRPVATGVDAIADRLNRFQFLTIRQYLSLVFAALVGLLLVLALWP